MAVLWHQDPSLHVDLNDFSLSCTTTQLLVFINYGHRSKLDKNHQNALDILLCWVAIWIKKCQIAKMMNSLALLCMDKHPKASHGVQGSQKQGRSIKASNVSCAAAPCPPCDPGSSTATLPASQRLPANYSPCVFPFTAKTLSTSPLCKMLLSLPWTLKTIQY